MRSNAEIRFIIYNIFDLFLVLKFGNSSSRKKKLHVYVYRRRTGLAGLHPDDRHRNSVRGLRSWKVTQTGLRCPAVQNYYITIRVYTFSKKCCKPTSVALNACVFSYLSFVLYIQNLYTRGSLHTIVVRKSQYPLISVRVKTNILNVPYTRTYEYPRYCSILSDVLKISNNEMM